MKPQRQNHKLVFCHLNYIPDVEGVLGIEPRARESEPLVLPLHHTPAGLLRIELKPGRSKRLMLTVTPQPNRSINSCLSALLCCIISPYPYNFPSTTPSQDAALPFCQLSKNRMIKGPHQQKRVVKESNL